MGKWTEKVISSLLAISFLFSTFIQDISLTSTAHAAGAAPVASNLSFSTPMNSAKLVTLVATDAENDALTYSIVTPPIAAQGTLTLVSGANYTFNPTTSFVGNATFTYRANDGTSNSNTATVTMSVNTGELIPSNQLPLPGTWESAGIEGGIDAMLARNTAPASMDRLMTWKPIPLPARWRIFM